MSSNKMNILFLIRSLEVGGAERQCALTASLLKEKGHSVTVMVLYGGGAMEKELLSKNVRIISLNKKGRWDVIGFLFRFFKEVKKLKPDIVQSFLVVSNLLSLLLKIRFPRIKIIWGLRASNMELNKYDWLNSFTGGLEKLFSDYPHHIIVNSYAGYLFAKSKGYPAHKMTVISNGIDVARFCPDEKSRIEMRQFWKISPEELLIGMVGRWDPMKDHLNFFSAAKILLNKYPHCKFICLGGGSEVYGEYLKKHPSALALGNRLIWEEKQEDMPKVYNAFDLLCQTSEYGEGFSNVIAEAMASGCPVVATDVGDSAFIVGEDASVVPPKDPEAFAEACLRILSRKSDARLIREKIVSRFSVEALVNKTMEVYKI